MINEVIGLISLSLSLQKKEDCEYLIFYNVKKKRFLKKIFKKIKA